MITIELQLGKGGFEAPGFVTVEADGVRPNPIRVWPSSTRILGSLDIARRRADAIGLRGAARGWITADEMSHVINKDLRYDYRLDDSTVSRYLNRVLQVVLKLYRQAGIPTGEPPIEHERWLGYRLAEEVNLVILRSPPET